MKLPSIYKSRAIKAVVLAGTLAALSFLGACAANDKKQQKPAASSVPVTIALAQKKDVPLQITAIGAVEAYNTVGIKSQVTGEITSVNFREGQDVKKGQLLFTIDRRPMDADLRRAEATLAKDSATAANDRAEAERYEALFKQGVVARQQLDRMVAQANASEALVKADQAAVQNARVQLQYTSIHAPISGRTGNLMVQLGNIAKANPDSPIVTINQVEPVYVTFTIPEQFLSEVKRYMGRGTLRVAATVPNDPTPAIGNLTFVDNAVDRQTGTIKLKATFPNKDRRLWPGQFANATLTLAVEPNVTTVPSQAVQTSQQGQFVFVIREDNTAEVRPVTVSRTVGNESVITGGIQTGDRVVTDGQLRLVAGAKVEIRNNTPGGQNATAPQQTGKNEQALKQD
ncbi:MAG TPA: efflux RND transporter periplasmic adaptor subunit [Terriglobales bacterium]|nr:efflux RND transporter periplasmic adaptor subunit [Terriglobales bacterium]